MDYLLKTDENYPFNQLKLHSPQPIQGGTYLFISSGHRYYFKHLNTIQKEVFIKQKKIYCDLLFDTDNVEFIEWLNTMKNTFKN